MNNIMRNVTYITRHELKKMILQNKPNFQVIDVRDDDFEEGNIINAINIPSAM